MWRAITEADLLNKISGAELTAFRASVLADGQGDPIQTAIDQQSEIARGYIGRCQNNFPLGAGLTLPSMLIPAVVDLIIMDVMSRAGGVIIDPDGVRKSNASKATALLRDVARCMFVIEAATTPSTEALALAHPSFKGRQPKFSRCDENGI